MSVQEPSAIIFNIQKFSLHDGPGVRTVVFLKGCPLRCRWCSNPESQMMAPQILWDSRKCIGCGTCVTVCPASLAPAAKATSPDCTHCGTCVSRCPTRALTLEGERKTVTQVLEVCLQDLPFYEESGGGVTLSGGEALLQPDFSEALLRALHDRGIHTAIETTGYAPPEVFDRVTAHADLLLFDIKHWNEQKHLEGTGVSNRLILENMTRAITAGAKVLPRLPVIPGYNNALSDAQGFVERLREVEAAQVQLLPFHQFGESKYAMMDRDYPYAAVPALHEEDLRAFQQIFLDSGIQAFF